MDPVEPHPGIDRCFDRLQQKHVALLLEGFRRSYAADWIRWRNVLAKGPVTSDGTAVQSRAILQS